MTLPLEHAGHVAPDDLIERRVQLAQAVAAGYWRIESAPEQIELGGIRCLRFPAPKTPRGIVLHIHGGAFRIGCPEMIAPYAAALAARCAVTVICPAYRLAPEYPFPAGLNDCGKVLTELVEGPVILSGDSAGGGLAASLAADPTIRLAGLALLSPWLDLTVSSASYATNANSDPLFSAESAREASRLYLQGISADEPTVSPLLGPVGKFPPTYINVGAGEVLLNDAIGLHARLQSAGIAVRLDVIEAMDHVAVARDRALPGAAQTFDTLATFIDLAIDGRQALSDLTSLAAPPSRTSPAGAASTCPLPHGR